MYAVNGIPLDNPEYQWAMLTGSKPISELTRERAVVSQSGRDGVVRGMAATTPPPQPTFIVQTPRVNLEALLSLWGAAGVLSIVGAPGRVVEFETLATTYTGYLPGDALIDLAVRVRLPGSFWRDAIVSTSPATALVSASATVSGLFPGLSAEVQDAVVRVKGAATGLQVTDSGGSWFTYSGALNSSQWLRFEADSGRAFVTSTDTWTGGTEVSGDVDYGGPRGIFEISPKWTTDPAVRAGQLIVATGSRSAASVQVRGRAAFLL